MVNCWDLMVNCCWVPGKPQQLLIGRCSVEVGFFFFALRRALPPASPSGPPCVGVRITPSPEIVLWQLIEGFGTQAHSPSQLVQATLVGPILTTCGRYAQL